jgi:hypothetical protein
VSGGDQEGVALKARPLRGGFTVEASLFSKVASEPGCMRGPGMSLAVARIAGQVVSGVKVARAWSAAAVRNGGERARIVSPGRLGGGERENPERLKRDGVSTGAGARSDRAVGAPG